MNTRPFCFALTLILFLTFFSSCSAQQVEKPVGLKINNFDECVAAGFAILKSVPARCVGPDGTIHTQDISKGGATLPAPQRKKLCVDRCGDGTCQEIVCLAEGCPCAESPERCPADCRKD